jgi:hypothetical protein
VFRFKLKKKGSNGSHQAAGTLCLRIPTYCTKVVF